MKKFKVKILPNVHGKKKWYYGYLNNDHDLTGKTVSVHELESEPVFKNCYRFDNGTSFIDKDDCQIIETL